MRSMIRRTGWLLSGVFVLLAALLVASTVNVLVEASLAPPMPGEQSALHPVRVAQRPEGPAPDGAQLAKLTGLTFDTRAPVPAAPPELTDFEKLPRSTLPVRLLGTLVAQDVRWSLASLQEQSATRARSLMVGDDLLGARVVAIERERIILVVNGREEYVDGSALGPARDPLAATMVRAVPDAAQPPGSELGKGIRAVGEHAYEIPRMDLQEALARTDQLAMQARVVPAFKDGRSVGFKVLAVRQGSFFTRLGLQSGDVLTRINGLDTNSPDKLLELYSRLQNTPHIEVELERNGAPVKKVYDVR